MEGPATAEFVGASDVVLEPRAVNLSSCSCAVEAHSGDCTAGRDFHMPVLDKFCLRCLQEELTDKPEAWNAGEFPYCGIFGNLHRSPVGMPASLAPMGIIRQPTTCSTAGHVGTTMEAMGVFRLSFHLSHTDAPYALAAAAAQRRAEVVSVAPATREAGPVGDEGSGNAPSVDFHLRGAAGPAGGRDGWSGQRSCRATLPCVHTGEAPQSKHAGENKV